MWQKFNSLDLSKKTYPTKGVVKLYYAFITLIIPQ